MDSEAQNTPPNPPPTTGEGAHQTVTTAPLPAVGPTTERKRRIQWGNYKGPQDTLRSQLPTYLSLVKGKKEWVVELANTLVKDDTFMKPLKEKGFTAGDVRDSIWNWYHNHTTKVTKNAIPAGKNPLWAAFTARKVSPSRLYIKSELAKILEGTGGKKDIGLIAKVGAKQFSGLPLEERQKWEKEAEEASKPEEGQCWINQLHAMPVFGDLFTKLIGRGHKQLGDCAFYLRFIYLDERGVAVEEEMCVSANTLLEPYTSTPDPDWKRWSKQAVNEHFTPIAADDDDPLVGSQPADGEALVPSPAAATSPIPQDSGAAVSASVASAPSLTSRTPANQDPAAVPVAVTVPSVGLNNPASTTTCPSTPVSARRTRRVENIPELPALNHVESLEWLRGVVQSHLDGQWRDAGWESPLDWTIVEGDRERYIACASFWQRRETLCPAKLELLQCMSFYNDLATAWNTDKTLFFKDARDASQPTPRRRVISLTPRTPRTPQTPSRFKGPQVGDIQLPAPLTLVRAALSRRSSSSTLPSTPQRHRESSGLYPDPADFIPMDGASPGPTHAYAENQDLPEPWEVLDSAANGIVTASDGKRAAAAVADVEERGTLAHNILKPPVEASIDDAAQRACEVAPSPLALEGAGELGLAPPRSVTKASATPTRGEIELAPAPNPSASLTPQPSVQDGLAHAPEEVSGPSAPHSDVDVEHARAHDPPPTSETSVQAEAPPAPEVDSSTPAPETHAEEVARVHSVANQPAPEASVADMSPQAAGDGAEQPAPGRRARGRGRGRAPANSSIRPMTRRRAQEDANTANADAVNANVTNGAPADRMNTNTDNATSANSVNVNTASASANTVNTANANANAGATTNGARNPSRSFKLKLANNTAILAINGAPPQHVIGGTASGEVHGRKRKREEDTQGGRKRARTNDENSSQQGADNHARPQRNRAPAWPRSAMPKVA